MSDTRIIFCALVLASQGLQAIDVTFPNADGQGDLASPASWGLAELPDSTNRIAFVNGGGHMTLTATEDIDFAGIYHNGESRAITLDMRNENTGANPGPRKINLTGSICMGKKFDKNLIIKGGEWNLNGNEINIFEGSYAAVRGQRISISGGAHIYGVKEIIGSYGSTYPASIKIAGEGTAVTSGAMRVAFYNAISNTVHVSDGAALVLTNKASGTLNVANGASSFCGIVVSNGAYFAKTERLQSNGLHLSASYLSGQNGENYLHVLYGSTATINGLSYLGYADDPAKCVNSHNNTILVSGASSVTNSSLAIGDIYLGSMTGADSSTFNTNNCIVVRDGAEFKTGTIRLHGSMNGIVVSNAVVTLTGGSGIECGNTTRGCTNCFVRLQGDAPRLIHSSTLTGNSSFDKSFHFIYDLPPNGYAPGIVPVRLERWSKMASSTEFVFNGIEEMQASMRRRRVSKVTYTMFAASGGVNNSPSGVPQSCLDRCNLNLPQGAKLTGNSGRTALYLTVESLAGTLMIFR